MCSQDNLSPASHLALSQTASWYRSQRSLSEGWFPVRRAVGTTLHWQLAEVNCVHTSAALSHTLKAGQWAPLVLFERINVPISLWFRTQKSVVPYPFVLDPCVLDHQAI